MAARQCVEAAGYGQFLHHRTGHGIGMECHEDPYIHGEIVSCWRWVDVYR